MTLGSRNIMRSPAASTVMAITDATCRDLVDYKTNRAPPRLARRHTLFEHRAQLAIYRAILMHHSIRQGNPSAR
jgi:hypothetical protein